MLISSESFAPHQVRWKTARVVACSLWRQRQR